MIRSMTGYGQGEYTLYDRKFTVEIKSVNSRYNELNIKMPRTLNSFETEIKTIISEEVSRGKTDVYISLVSFSRDDTAISIDENLLDAYMEQLIIIKDKYKLSTNIPLELLANYEGVIKTNNTITNPDVLAEMWETLFVAINSALANFISMREDEGESLKKDILLKVYDLGTYLQEVKDIVPDIMIENELRLKKRLTDTLQSVNYDENRLLQELAIQADKSSIDEEVVRLDSHLVQLVQILEQDGSIGRKLDFLVQEMNRETNTIGSKSTNLQLTKNVVEIKTILEKIREQIQNIE